MDYITEIDQYENDLFNLSIKQAQNLLLKIERSEDENCDLVFNVEKVIRINKKSASLDKNEVY